jgi:hypothetical protein
MKVATKSKKGRKKKMGCPMKHGGYSLIHRDALLKEHPRLRYYLEDVRVGLVQDVAGSEDALSEQQRVMIDRIISRLSICRLIEIYCEKYGVFRRDQVKGHKVLELEPALGINYLAFSNSIDRALQALGLNKKKTSDVLDLGRYISEKDQAAKAAGKAGAQAQAGQGPRQDEARDGQDKAPETGAIVKPGSSSNDIPGQADPETREGQD